MIIKVGEHSFDLSKSLPLTVGDLEDLEAAGVTFAQDANGNLIGGVKSMKTVLAHLLRKANGGQEVPDEIVRGITTGQMIQFQKELAEQTREDMEEPNRPT